MRIRKHFRWLSGDRCALITNPYYTLSCVPVSSFISIYLVYWWRLFSLSSHLLYIVSTKLYAYKVRATKIEPIKNNLDFIDVKCIIKINEDLIKCLFLDTSSITLESMWYSNHIVFDYSSNSSRRTKNWN